jgi:hypothetical protein
MQIKVNNRKLIIPDNGSFDLEKYPNFCPLCHTSISLDGPYTENVNLVNLNSEYKDRDYDNVQLIFRCSACFRLFISNYCQRHAAGELFWYSGSYPKKPKKVVIDKVIESEFPNFVEIYRQANIAEFAELEQIAGCGYRKSLEFLIKDYCISFLKKDPDHIRDSMLSQCIRDDIDESNIKDCALRATWLGNDEAHYHRKWETKDVEDLKKLIELTMSWIKSHILTEQFKKEMPEKK